MKYQNSDYRYTLIHRNGDLIECDNKKTLIAIARNKKTPCFVVDNKCQGIIFENRAQIDINNKI